MISAPGMCQVYPVYTSDAPEDVSTALQLHTSQENARYVPKCTSHAGRPCTDYCTIPPLSVSPVYLNKATYFPDADSDLRQSLQGPHTHCPGHNSQGAGRNSSNAHGPIATHAARARCVAVAGTLYAQAPRHGAASLTQSSSHMPFLPVSMVCTMGARVPSNPIPGRRGFHAADGP